MSGEAKLRGKLAVCEQFASVQGEGASAGKPCVFLRLAHCNLRCSWCDTKYSWDFATHRYEDEVRVETLAEVARGLLAAEPERVVITGGEPLIQRRELEALCELLPHALPLEVETNGTLAPGPVLLARIDQWNVSPKLANSGEPPERRVKPAVLRELAATGRAYLKLVVADPAELDEVTAIVEASAWPHERVLLMPQAATRAELAARGEAVRLAALARGYGYSSRLHIELWDGQRGR